MVGCGLCAPLLPDQTRSEQQVVLKKEVAVNVSPTLMSPQTFSWWNFMSCLLDLATAGSILPLMDTSW